MKLTAALSASRPTDAGAGEPLQAREIAAQFYDKRDPLDRSYGEIAHNIRRGRYDDQDSVELVRFTIAALATPKPPVDEAMRERCAVVVDEYAQSCARHADSCIGAEQHEWNRAAEELDMAATRIRNLTGDGGKV